MGKSGILLGGHGQNEAATAGLGSIGLSHRICFLVNMIVLT